MGVDVTQRILSIRKHEVSDPFPLKLSLKQGLVQLVHNDLERTGVHINNLTVHMGKNQFNLCIQVEAKDKAVAGGDWGQKGPPGSYRAMTSVQKTEQQPLKTAKFPYSRWEGALN